MTEQNTEQSPPVTTDGLGYIPDDPRTGHSYDGIEEYDNPMPGWWKAIFLGTVVFSVFYYIYFNPMMENRSIYAEYEQDVAENVRLQFAGIGELSPTPETVLKYTYDDRWLKVGKSVYKTHCVSCHGTDGGGKIGPNLCDDNYKNVNEIGDILTVVQNGAAFGAMPAWKTKLEVNEMVLVSSYVASLRGTKPASGKSPEGKAIPPWPGPEAVPADPEPEADQQEAAEQSAE